MMLFITLATWVVATGVVTTMLKHLSKQQRIAPVFCWLALLVPLLVFVPQLHHAPLAESMPVWLTQTGLEQIGYASEVAKQVTSATSLPIQTAILLLLMGVSAYRVGRFVFRYHKAKQLIKAGTPYQHINETCSILPSNQSPFVVGFKHPIIALPQYFMALAPHQQAVILRHEQTHIHNKDHRHIWLWQLAIEACWFNPFIKQLKGVYINAIEQRCDSQTLKALSISPLEYAQTLLTSLKLSQQSAPTTHFAQFCSQDMSVDDHKARLTHIVKQTPTPKLKAAVVISLCAVFIALSKQAFTYIAAIEESWHYPVNNVKMSAYYGHIAKIRNNWPHGGIDLVDKKGSDILAARSGKVTIADWQTLPKRYGKTVVILHSNGWQTLYAHLDDYTVQPGQWVKQGEVIGKMGDTGKVTGTHLHFEMAHHGQKQDPIKHLTRQ